MSFLPGDKVMVTAKTDWCAFIDGYKGTVTGFASGMVGMAYLDPDDGIEKLFYVPADELTLTF